MTLFYVYDQNFFRPRPIFVTSMYHKHDRNNRSKTPKSTALDIAGLFEYRTCFKFETKFRGGDVAIGKSKTTTQRKEKSKLWKNTRKYVLQLVEKKTIAFERKKSSCVTCNRVWASASHQIQFKPCPDN